ncbi:nicotinamide n-methyltransferase [Scheffersomyces spartinae]|uniref:Protein N-terminal and lysine N-methyltransferase EFM7 n=1 Tax=Scheffersomyces spartinae TaxID=45513 RepID=A0A9P7V6A2_9ASCO|nr:nicotinamide n-methyltransferase [Scheffersomyces spartinae]KAG7191704.1 nicotinamide n-methyltransferase [Scheffersomyces spartinae]
MSDDDLDLGSNTLFEEPEDFRPPPPEPHFANYENKINGTTIPLRLVGSSPLWGNYLWNAGIYTADYINAHPEIVRDKKVLELGAAAGLPSIVSALNNASYVLCTDYPEADLIANIDYNFQHNPVTSSYMVKGYIWGNSLGELLYNDSQKDEISEEDKFDLIILSDLVFNHSEHHKLLSTCRRALRKNGKCIVVFSPHRPWLLENDLLFFTTCEEYDFKAEQIELVQWKPMFENDKGSAEIRSRVYSYFLKPQW